MLLIDDSDKNHHTYIVPFSLERERERERKKEREKEREREQKVISCGVAERYVVPTAIVLKI